MTRRFPDFSRPVHHRSAAEAIIIFLGWIGGIVLLAFAVNLIASTLTLPSLGN